MANNSISNFYPSKKILMVTGFITSILFLLWGLTVWNFYKAETPSVYDQPRIILDFLNDVTNYDVDLASVVTKYFEGYSDTSENIEISREYINLDYIIRSTDSNLSGYEISSSSSGYVSLTLLDSQHNPLYPKVLLAYVLTLDNSSIADYTLSRLQPLSRLNEEYGEKW